MDNNQDSASIIVEENTEQNTNNYQQGQEMFVQDSNGVVSTSNKDLSIDTSMDAPFRPKEAPQVPPRLSPSAANGAGYINASTKIGEYIHRSQATQIMRKGGQQLSPRVAQVEYQMAQRANNIILEESTFKGETNYYHNQQSTHQSIVYAQSSSKTLSELVNEPKNHDYQNSPSYPQVAASAVPTVSVTKPQAQAQQTHVRTYENVNYEPMLAEQEQDYIVEESINNNEDYYNNSQLTIDSNSTATNDYVSRNMLSPGSSNLPTNPISPSTDSVNSDASSSYVKSPKEKGKRNIFGSLFGNKSKKNKDEKSSSRKASKNK